jgi:hypothetical protein
MLNLLDDTPIVPGDAHPAFGGGEMAREVLNDAEDELRNWQANIEPIHSYAGALGAGAMPSNNMTGTGTSAYGSEVGLESQVQDQPMYQEKAAGSEGHVVGTGSSGPHIGGETQSLDPMTEAERKETEHAAL